ncbi:MAG: dethiobiotin synthetase [Candidatus Omnitrophota bacterium]|jgi:dethiobiotin synthetase
MSGGWFITGTDTDIGKTIVTGSMARYLINQKKTVQVLKPFSSGSWEDTLFLKKCAKSKSTKTDITPFYFKYPLAPMASLELEGRSLDKKQIKTTLIQSISQSADYSLVEGIGGAMVPILDNYPAMQIAKDLKLPALIVASISLGTINHTLMTIEVLRQQKVPIAGIILNTLSKNSDNYAAKTNPDLLRKLRDVPIWGVLPYVSKAMRVDPNALAQLFKKHIAVDTYLC